MTMATHVAQRLQLGPHRGLGIILRTFSERKDFHLKFEIFSFGRIFNSMILSMPSDTPTPERTPESGHMNQHVLAVSADTLDRWKSQQSEINKRAIKSWPQRLDWKIIHGFDERHGDYRLPTDVSTAIMRSMLAIALLRSHDPIVIERTIGYPMRFLSLLNITS
jgi:hypothetical protein